MSEDDTMNDEEKGSGPISIITCDMEGRIETYNEGAEEIFQYSGEEIIGKRRVSMFSPGEVVLGHVGSWLATASNDGEYNGKTAFIRKDGSRFAAQFKITPTYKTIDGNRVQVGFCGRTEPLLDVNPNDVTPKTSFLTRMFAWLIILRLPFVSAAILPAILGLVWVHYADADLATNWLLVFAIIGAAAFMHLSANVFNDVFDVIAGTDDANNDYFLGFSGGSRAVELGIITIRGQIILASTLIALASLIGAWVMFGPPNRAEIWMYGFAGAAGGFFYTAPPLKLSSRHGLGELVIGLLFGPLMTMGSVYAYTGSHSMEAFLLGIPLGLLTTAILWINEFPDTPSDIATGKIHLVATMGLERARYGYASLLVAAFGSLGWLYVAGIIPAMALIGMFCVPWAAYLTKRVFAEYNDRSLTTANAQTIYMHMAAALLVIVGTGVLS